MSRYTLSVVAGSFLISLCGFSANTLQIWAGSVRRRASKPLLIPLGLLLGCAICLVGLVRPGDGAFWLLMALVLLTGAGVAMLHPEALRGVCAIDHQSVSPAVATSVFMLAGFLGGSSGPLVSGVLVSTRFGLHGLFLLLIPVVLMLYFFRKLRIRLAPDQPPPARKATPAVTGDVSFWKLCWIAFFINTGCMIMQGLLPTFLAANGFSLIFSGLSAMLFGLGAGLSALFTSSVLIKRVAVLSCIKVQIIAGVPLLTGYLLLAERHPAAALLAFLAGAFVGAGFPQLVTLARTAPNGPSLGVRMGIIVGGTWGVAGVLFPGIGALAEFAGLRTALLTAPLFFAAAVVLLQFLPRRRNP